MTDNPTPERKIKSAQDAYRAVHAFACAYLEGWIDGGCGGEKEFPDMLALSEFIETVEGKIADD